MKHTHQLKYITFILASLTLAACGGGGGGTGTGGGTGGTSPPSVTATTPINNSTGVLTNSLPSATFNNDMNITSLTASSFTLDGATPLNGSVSYDAATRTAIYTPTVPLRPGTVHTASLTTAVTGTNGQSLPALYQWQFTTENFIQRISLGSNTIAGNNSSYNPSSSADGRYIVFASAANNLISGDTNGVDDIFLHDSQTGTTIRVSVDSNGNQTNNSSSFPTISADGRYVVFVSDASNLVSSDTNGLKDIFVHDTQTGTTTRGSVDSNATQSNSNSRYPDISADGRYIVFESSASNLVSNDTNSLSDIFLHDNQTGITARVSVDSGNGQVSGSSTKPVISDNGRYIAFESSSNTLVSGDSNGVADIFLRDTQTGTTTRVSVDSNGNQSNSTNYPGVSISGDGRYVAFASRASNLVSGDTNSATDIFVRDTQTGTTIRVSVDSNGNQGNASSFAPSATTATISANGRYVAFQSDASNLVAADTNGVQDIFVHDTQTGITRRISLDANGTQANSFSGSAVMSDDGRYVAFDSSASNLVSGDSNGVADVFRALNTTP